MDFAASHPPNSQARDDDTAPRLSIASAHRRFARGAHCPLSRSAGKKTSPRTANKKRVGVEVRLCSLMKRMRYPESIADAHDRYV